MNTIQDPEFGELTWDSGLTWWAGSIHLSAPHPFQLYIHTPSETERDITAEARQAAELIRASEAGIRSYAADRLLETYNSVWNESDEDLSAAEFVRRLVPEAVVLYPRGYAEVLFADDDMFGGHAVEIRIRLDGTYQEAVVSG